MMHFWLLTILLAAMAAPFVARWLGSFGSWLLATVSACVFAALLKKIEPIAQGELLLTSLDWVPQLNLVVSLRLDGLGLLFALLITGIGSVVLVYAGAYLKGDDRLGLLHMFLLLFMGSMLGLVLADNLLTLFIFWELTSITSYLLIGFNNENPASRASALQALLVTGGGGLALLPGLILLGVAGQSFEVSELVQQAEAVRQHAFYLPALLLILVGAFTKSAQFPFHFWLPDAMAAPTPISAYLHSATMVKAGVYLLARLHPVLGGTPEWFWLIASTGAITTMLGAIFALRAVDLKQILAYATISVLGTLTMLLGIGTEGAIIAALAMLVAHALYKGGLFMVAGAIDHAIHQRDVRQLGGLRSVMPMTLAAAALGGLSMVAVLPMFGFVAKELYYESLGSGFLAIAVVSNVLLFVAAGLVCLKPFFGTKTAAVVDALEGSAAMWVCPLVLGLASLALGLWPSALDRLLAAGSGAIAGESVSLHLALWHGINTTLLLSLVTLAAGVALYRHRDRLSWLVLSAAEADGEVSRETAGTAQTREMHPAAGNVEEAARGKTEETWKRFVRSGLQILAPSACYRWLLKSVNDVARWQTSVLQNGYLSMYLLTMIIATVFSVWLSLRSGSLSRLTGFEWDVRIHEGILVGLILAAAVVAVRAGTWLLAVAALGVIGYCVAGLFVLFGAPDLAMTQFVIETLTVVLLVMAFSRLPDFRRLSTTKTRWRDASIAIAAGGTITLLLLLAMTVRSANPISSYFATHSVEDAHGRNLVNVILVDFRALDTLGEITVLAIASLGVYSLLTLRPPEACPQNASQASPDPDEEGLSLMDTIILKTASRLLLPILMLFSVFLFLRGHNEPGGGFVGGLMATGAVVLFALANGVTEAKKVLRVPPRVLIAAGLLLGLISGLLPVFAGRNFLTGLWIDTTVPGFGAVHLGTPLLFDVSVYCVVTGVSLVFVFSLLEE